MPKKWLQEDVQILIERYAETPNEELIKLLGKSKDSIVHKAKSLGLSKSLYWTLEQDQELTSLYTQLSTEHLMYHFNRSKDSIIQRASQLGLKKGFDFHRHSDASVLLNDSLVTMYWIGFLLADGTFPSANGNKGSQLTLILAEKDSDHLQKFADYIKLERPIKRREYPTNKVDKFVGYEVTIGDSDRLPLLCERFDIHSNKTYYPPDFSKYNLTDAQWVVLALGLIDGDGYIDSKVIRARIKCHTSWGPSYQILSDKITEWAGVKPVKVHHQNTCCMLTLGKKVVQNLYTFAIQNQIPLLNRKWDSVTGNMI